jgi:hypothetical protein
MMSVAQHVSRSCYFSFESLERHIFLSNVPLFTEVVAANNLAGCNITGNDQNLDKWTFRASTQSVIPTGGYVVGPCPVRRRRPRSMEAALSTPTSSSRVPKSTWPQPTGIWRSLTNTPPPFRPKQTTPHTVSEFPPSGWVTKPRHLAGNRAPTVGTHPAPDASKISAEIAAEVATLTNADPNPQDGIHSNP